MHLGITEKPPIQSRISCLYPRYPLKSFWTNSHWKRWKLQSL